MALFSHKNGEPKDDITQEPPKLGLGRFLFVLRTHFFKLLLANLLFVGFSIPVFTLPAALCAMNRVIIKLVRDGNCFLWDEFIKEFKSELLKAFPTGVFFLILLVVAYYSIGLAVSNLTSMYGVLFGALGLFSLIVEGALSSYAFVMLPLVDLRAKDVLNNAWRVALLAKGRTAAALFIKLVFLVPVVYFFPYTLILAVILPALVGLALCTLVNPAIEKYVISADT